MCGIAGAAFRLPHAPADFLEHLSNGLTKILHRGPDMRGHFHGGSVWMGHVRLSVMDLSAAAAQPMVVDNGRFSICYNGEVYNFRDIAQRLGLNDLMSKSDTEVVIRAFAKVGTTLFERLNGMFAIALYDRQLNKLWLVRDRLGIKPLYYSLDSRRLYFSSEIKALTAMSGGVTQWEVGSLHEWVFYGNTLGEKTLYQSVKKLLPGHYLELDLSTFSNQVVEYWSPHRQLTEPTLSSCSRGELEVEIRRLLEQAVKRQLVSDVPIGIFLSGGIDSSAITAFASKHYSGKLATYSAGFDFASGINELSKARRVAEHYGTEHNEIHISGGEIPDIVERMVIHHDAPFSDAANIPLFLLATTIRDKTKVVLQGDGGDELFGGYRRYVTLSYHRLLRPLATVGQFLNRLTPRTAHHYRRQRYLDALAAPDLATTMALLLTEEDIESQPASMFSPTIRNEVNKYDPFCRYRQCQRYFKDRDVVAQMSLIDSMIILPDIFLEKVDRSTMAASLEVRVPFLDYDLFDYCMKIPGGRKMPFGKKKALLKQALRGILPNDVLDAPKTGFGVPYGYWLKTALKPLFFDHLEQFQREHPNVLHKANIVTWYSEHESGSRDWSFRLWKVLNLMIWINKCKVVPAL
jgi:asparagine synthase (glutamine-hydrolysing)